MFAPFEAIETGLNPAKSPLHYRGVLELEEKEYYLFETREGRTEIEISHLVSEFDRSQPKTGVSQIFQNPSDPKHLFLIVPTIEQYNRWGSELNTHFRLKPYRAHVIDETIYAGDLTHRAAPVATRYIGHDIGDHGLGYLLFPKLLDEAWRTATLRKTRRLLTTRVELAEATIDLYNHLQIYDQFSSKVSLILERPERNLKERIDDVSEVIEAYVASFPEFSHGIHTQMIRSAATQVATQFEKLKRMAFPRHFDFEKMRQAIEDGSLTRFSNRDLP